MRFIGNVEEDTQIRAVASGTLSNGDTVVVNSDGTVSAVAGVSGGLGSETTFASLSTTYLGIGFDSNVDRFIICYYDQSVGRGKVVAGEVDGTSVSFGTPVTLGLGTTVFAENPIAFSSSANKIVIGYRDNGKTNVAERGQAVVATIDPSDNSVSLGTSVDIGTNADGVNVCYDETNDKMVFSFRDFSNSYYGTAIVGTVSGTSISFGTKVAYRSAQCIYNANAYDANAGKVAIFWRDIGSSGYGRSIIGTVSGTSISFGSIVNFQTTGTENISCTYDSSAQKILLTFSSSNNYGQIRTGTISGTSISYGTEALFNLANTGYVRCAYNATADNTIVVYRDNGNSAYATYVPVTVSGTDCTAGTEVVLNAATSTNPAVAHGANSSATLMIYTDGDGGLDYGNARVLAEDSTNITSENFIGFADSGYLSGQNVGIDSTGSVNRSQSGLTAGQKYYVQNDGSLSTTADDPSVEAGVAISATEILVKG